MNVGLESNFLYLFLVITLMNSFKSKVFKLCLVWLMFSLMTLKPFFKAVMHSMEKLWIWWPFWIFILLFIALEIAHVLVVIYDTVNDNLCHNVPVNPKGFQVSTNKLPTMTIYRREDVKYRDICIPPYAHLIVGTTDMLKKDTRAGWQHTEVYIVYEARCTYPHPLPPIQDPPAALPDPSEPLGGRVLNGS